MTAPTRPTTCPQGHAIEWLTETVAICRYGEWLLDDGLLRRIRPSQISDTYYVALREARAERDAALQKAKDLQFTVESLEMGVRSFRDERDAALADNAALIEAIKMFDSYFSECPECGAGGKPHLAHCSMKRVYAQAHPGAFLLAVVEAARIFAHFSRSMVPGDDTYESTLLKLREALSALDALGERKEGGP